jgi:SAM-dependent methyltransferase
LLKLALQQELKMRPCFVCESELNVHHHATVDQHDYLRCSRCGLIFVDQIESREKLYRSYNGSNWKSLRRKLVAPLRGFSHVRNFAQSMARANRIFEFVLSISTPSSARPVLLDIGCNKGFLLAAAIARSWEVYGVELVPELTIPFRKKFKPYAHHVFAMRFIDAQARLEDETCDVVTAIDVIEHFEEPARDVSSIYRILKPGGLFVFQTPDGACVRAETLKERWGALKPLEHLQIFSKSNLELLAAKQGFREIEFFDPFEAADGNLVAVMRK